MIAILAAILLFSSGVTAFAAEESEPSKWPRMIFAAGVQPILEKEGIENRYLLRLPYMVRGGLEVKRADLLAEFSSFDVTNGEGSISVKRTQRFLLAWLRYHLERQEDIQPFLGIGVGAEEETVTTTLGSQSTRVTGTPYLMGGLSTGASWIINEIVELGGEFRVLAAAPFRPNPTIGAVVFIGIRN